MINTYVVRVILYVVKVIKVKIFFSGKGNISYKVLRIGKIKERWLISKGYWKGKMFFESFRKYAEKKMSGYLMIIISNPFLFLGRDKIQESK